jgi:Flp pilus assembly protein TadG
MDAIRRLAGRKADAGAELIEFALVVPCLLLVCAAIMDFGFLFQRYEVLTNAAREGARIAVLPNYTASDARARVQTYLTASGLTNTAPTADVTFGTETTPSGQTFSDVKVTAYYPSGFLILGPIAKLVGGTGYSTITLAASAVMRVESAGS